MQVTINIPDELAAQVQPLAIDTVRSISIRNVT